MFHNCKWGLQHLDEFEKRLQSIILAWSQNFAFKEWDFMSVCSVLTEFNKTWEDDWFEHCDYERWMLNDATDCCRWSILIYSCKRIYSSARISLKLKSVNWTLLLDLSSCSSMKISPAETPPLSLRIPHSPWSSWPFNSVHAVISNTYEVVGLNLSHAPLCTFEQVHEKCFWNVV